MCPTTTCPFTHLCTLGNVSHICVSAAAAAAWLGRSKATAPATKGEVTSAGDTTEVVWPDTDIAVVIIAEGRWLG